MIYQEDQKGFDGQIQNFLNDAQFWEIEKIMALGVVHQVATYNIISEQTTVLKNILELLQATQKKS